MPRSCSAWLVKIIMPPLWPTSATGPGRTASGRSSVSVTRRLLAQTLPMQFGPDTASPVSAITAASSRPSAAACASKPSPKPAENTVALRAPAAAPRLSVSITPAAGTSTTMWSGVSGSALKSGVAGLAPDLGSARIDQIDRPGKLVAVEIVPHPRGPAAGPVAGADQNGVARRGERRDLVLGRLEIIQRGQIIQWCMAAATFFAAAVAGR